MLNRLIIRGKISKYLLNPFTNNNIFPKNLNTSFTLNSFKSSKFSSKNDDYKDKFKKMMESQGISKEEVVKKKEEEERKIKEEIEHSKKKYEEDSNKLKDKFSKLKSGIQDKEIEIDLNHIKNKFTSFLYSKKEHKPHPKETKLEDDEVKTDSTKYDGANTDNKADNISNNDNVDGKTETKSQFESTTNDKSTKSEKEEVKEKTKEELKAEEASKNTYFNRFLCGFKDLWQQTFPGEENIELIMQARKNKAKLLKSLVKEPTQEEIEEVNKYF